MNRTLHKLKHGIATAFLSISLSATMAASPSYADIEASDSNASNQVKTAIFAGGCFWCIEADFEKLEGVIEAVSGYSGGEADTATYKQVSHTETGHFEVVEVSYNPELVSYAELVEYFWIHIDPTDPHGQFCDKGSSYKSAIFYASDEEKTVLEASLSSLEKSKPFAAPIVTTLAPAKPFYKAEKYHQDYYKKNPIRYKYYRNGCRRDQRVKQLWGDFPN